MRQTILYPDYKRSLVNLMASIFSFYHLDAYTTTLPLCDQLLTHPYEKIVLVVLDGLGSEVLDACFKEKKSFLHAHKVGDFLSVYPPTTTAAITSILSGKPPIETAWFGWHQYFQTVNCDLVLFKNSGYYDETFSLPPKVAETTLPYVSLFDLLSQKGIRNEVVYPQWHEKGVEDFRAFCQSIDSFVHVAGPGFLYAYWDEPDSTLHEHGVGSVAVNRLVQTMDQQLATLFTTLPDDALILIVADHGHINIRSINLYKDSDIRMMLERPPSIESRTTAFFVKPEYHFLFKQVFRRRYGKYFKLIASQEALAIGLFGPGKAHPKANSFLGDFLAIAVADYSFFYQDKKQRRGQFKATHAGITRSEMLIPLIALTKTKSQ